MTDLETDKKPSFIIHERLAKQPNFASTTFAIHKQIRQSQLQDFDNETKTTATKQEAIALYNRANSAYSQGFDSLAHKLYLECASTCDYNSHILFTCYKNLGNILVRAGDLDGAEEFYNKAYTLQPDSDVLLVNLGTLEMQKHNLERALERYRYAVELNTTNPRAWIGLALVHREYGDWDLSWGNLERALDIDPYDMTALELMIEWGIKESKFEALIGRLDIYTQTHRQHIEMIETYIKVLIIGGRIEKARNYIDEILSESPHLAVALEFAKALSHNDKGE